jgi:glutamine synthetase
MEDIISADSFYTEVQLLQKVTALIKELNDKLVDLESKREKAEEIEDLSKKAKYFADHIVPALEAVREPSDALESIVPDSDWPLPKYSEMLFIM